MNDETVEKVARAICEADGDVWAANPDVCDEYRRLARAALAVMAGPDDTTRAVLAVADESLEPTRWWRVVAPDGSLWCETSDETEARDGMRPGDVILRAYKPGMAYVWRAQS